MLRLVFILTVLCPGIDDTIEELEELSLHPKVVAIGEIGLDYYRNGAPVEVQRMVFLTQLELAGNLGLPVIVHNRDASDEMMDNFDGLGRTHC